MSVERPQRGLIYNRVSSDPSARRVSVESQDSENRAWCARQGIEVAASITDNNRSASRVATKEREGYRDVRRALAGHTYGRIDYLVVWESSRAERTLDGYVELRNLCVAHNVRLVYKGRTFDMASGDDRFTTGIDALVDEREAARIQERILRGHRTSAAKGRPRGTVPYGYRREYDARTGYLMNQVPDPATAPVVAGIVADVLAGSTLYDIVRRLNNAGVLTPLGHKEHQAGIESTRAWTSTTIRRLLESKSMIGVRTHHGQAHAEATWEPIVSAADWARCQDILADPGRVAHQRGLAPRHLLSGVARCAVCAAWMRAAENRGRPVYQCAGWGPGDARGKGHVSKGPRALVEAFVVARTVLRLQDPELPRAIARLSVSSEAQRSDDSATLAELQARMAEFEESAKSLRGPAVGSVVAIIADYAEQIEAVRARMATAGAVPEIVLDTAGPGAGERWDRLDGASGGLDLQRQIVRTLWQVELGRSSRKHGSRGFDESTILMRPLL